MIFVAAILSFSLGFFVWRADKSSQLHRAYAFMAFIMGVWVLLNFFLQKTPNIILFELILASGPFVVTSIINWLAHVRKKQDSPGSEILLAILLITGILCSGMVFYDHLVVVGLQSATNVQLGRYFGIYAVYLGVTILVMISQVLITYFKMDNQGRRQVRLAYLGLTIFMTLAIFFDVVFPLLGRQNLAMLDSPSSLIFILFTAYSIVSQDLFQTKLLGTEFLVSSLTLILLSEAIFANTIGARVVNFAIAIVSGYLGLLLTGSVTREVSRRQELEKLAQERKEALGQLAERNKNLQTLQKISDIVLNAGDMQTMVQQILNELPKQLDSCIGGLLNVIRDGKLTAYSFSESSFSEKTYTLVNELSADSLSIKAGVNKLHDAVITKKVTDSSDLADFISPPISRTVALTLQKAIGAKHMEAFPLYAGGVPFGALLFVFSATRDEIHGKNFEIAKSIADEMSLAIQRAEAFQQLKDANEYLSQLDKMKDEFISMASHELNTPLAAIEGYLSMILDEHMGGKIDAKTKEYLSRAYDSSKRLAELVLDLLNVSRVEQGRLKMKYSQVNLADLAESVIHELQIKADAKKIYLKLDADKAKLPTTWCDPDRIREVFVNLTGNAIKFTEKGGVTIKIVPGEEKSIRASVTDTGRGIAKDDQKKLFQKFSQIHREVDEHQGTGLGLYISKNFVELHKGQLSVESDAGKGATFTFDLPIISESPKEVEGAILEGPLSAPKVEAATGTEVPAIITASTKQSM